MTTVSSTEETELADVVAEAAGMTEQTDVNTEETAGSSDAVDSEDVKEGPQSVLEAVLEATKSDDEGEESSSVSAKGDDEGEEAPDAQAAEGEELSDEVTDDEVKNYSHKAQKRIRGLVDERNQLREKTSEMDGLKGYMAQNNLTTENVNELLQVGALLRNDPAKALEVLKGYQANLEQTLGLKLDPALQEKVDLGYVDQQSALELSRAQAEKTRLENLRSQEQQHLQEQNAVQMRDAVNDLESQWKQSDPDYDRKAGFVRDRLQVALQQQRPAL